MRASTDRDGTIRAPCSPSTHAKVVAVWRSNPLFRLLVFLDIVGLQPLVIGQDLIDDGAFVDVARTFGVGSVAHVILSRGLHAFSSNITRLFVDEEERDKVLRLVGSPDEPTSSFSQGVLLPTSLVSFVDTVENDLPVWVVLRIKEAFGLMGSATPLAEQFLIDAVDDWMSGRSREANDAMVLACGVQPVVLESARARAEELPHAVEDFMVDVVFPPPRVKGEAGRSDLIDWLIVSYEKCYVTINVDDEEEGKESTSESTAKRWRTEEGECSDEFLTEENLDRYMRERPSVIPRRILCEKRRPLRDPAITEFELLNHYTANELYAFVKEEIKERRRLKKAECVRAILEYHGATKVGPSATAATAGSGNEETA
ncbi:hypothetical protein DQ04_02751040 [Trypanosoma grayi]|uniref:hypothetical protein n=1 Tax=Trypanosoma grayi TaxID=71804 RepID=UPI0004F4905C|nr:hypothetical protein DQ04_02751040 [Trypanosoma grayi]KEG11306.1 hypothetical protein DQ04_02751040 [Trypanosoma grayi]